MEGTDDVNDGSMHGRVVILILVAVVLTDLPLVVVLVDTCGHENTAQNG